MRQLLESMGISLPQALAKASVEDFPEMITVDGSVLLAQEYGLARSVSVKDFPDRTGYESFVNHFHIPYEGTRASLDGLLARVAAIRKGLERYAADRRFLIIVSISEKECTIRFHECRPPEAWLADSLEGYMDEAVAAISVGDAADR